MQLWMSQGMTAWLGPGRHTCGDWCNIITWIQNCRRSFQLLLLILIKRKKSVVCYVIGVELNTVYRKSTIDLTLKRPGEMLSYKKKKILLRFSHCSLKNDEGKKKKKKIGWNCFSVENGKYAMWNIMIILNHKYRYEIVSGPGWFQPLTEKCRSLKGASRCPLCTWGWQAASNSISIHFHDAN